MAGKLSTHTDIKCFIILYNFRVLNEIKNIYFINKGNITKTK